MFMRRTFAHSMTRVAAPALLAVLAGAGQASAGWTRWGGPNGDFTLPEAKILDAFPEGGPKVLWKRELTGGFSSIVVAEGVAFVAAREGDDERLLALDATTGEQKWEHRYTAKVPQPTLTDEQKKNPDRQPGEMEYIADFGFGPNSTPLVMGDRVITIGYMGHMHCLDRATGKSLWSHDFQKEFQPNFLRFGYSASPIAYRDTVIAPVGGKEHGLVAFNLSDGKVVWHKHDFGAGYSTPVIFQMGGRDLMAALVEPAIGVFDPTNGELLWSTPHQNPFNSYIPTPMICPGDRLFIGSDGGKGCRMFQLTYKDGQLDAKEEWNGKLKMAHFNAVRIGDRLLATPMQPEMVVAYGLSDGTETWKDRVFGKSNFVVAGEKVLALSDDGKLRLLKLLPDGVTVVSEAKVLGDKQVYSPPSLVGGVLFARDRERVVAVSLTKD